MLPDGTPFSVPDDVDHPRPLELLETARNSVVYLMLPTRQPGGMETAPADLMETVARFAMAEHEAMDTTPATRARRRAGRASCGCAMRPKARRGRATPRSASPGSPRCAPTRASCSTRLYPAAAADAAPRPALSGFVTQLQGLLHHRGRGAGRPRIGDRHARRGGDRRLSDAATVQPLRAAADAFGRHASVRCTRKLLPGPHRLAGELATFTETRKRPPAVPALPT